MEWLKLYCKFPRISEKQGLEAKKEVLLNYLRPLMKKLERNNLIETWNHTFQRGEIFMLVGTEGKLTEVRGKIQNYLTAKELEQGKDGDFYMKEEYPQKMADYWGKRNLETFARMKNLSSTLAIEAMEGNLGRNYKWHKHENRPGHIWLNQLGCSLLDEFEVCHKIATSRIKQVLELRTRQLHQRLNNQAQAINQISEKIRGATKGRDTPS